MVSRAHWVVLALLGLYVLSTLYIVIRLIVPLPFFFVLLPLSTLAFFAFSLTHAGLTLGWPRAVLFLAVTLLISSVLEGVGVATGLVYGAYAYTDRLGPKVLGLVPIYVPLAWFMMGYAAYALVARAAAALGLSPGWRADVWVALVGALAMTAWDLTMDPLMVSGGHWVWHTPGDYFGIPPSNYAGWMVTTFTIYLTYLRLATRIRAPLPQVPAPWWGFLCPRGLHHMGLGWSKTSLALSRLGNARPRCGRLLWHGPLCAGGPCPVEQACRGHLAIYDGARLRCGRCPILAESLAERSAVRSALSAGWRRGSAGIRALSKCSFAIIPMRGSIHLLAICSPSGHPPAWPCETPVIQWSGNNNTQFI
ncbi:MAG: carotenoid biosynthesis protein [Ardenticatenia bacterium]|nr:carotenoid biosynthesis protein [Ardenticatenia bacterium]